MSTIDTTKIDKKDKDPKKTSSNLVQQKEKKQKVASPTVNKGTEPVATSKGWLDVNTNMMESLGPRELAGIIGNEAMMKARQHLLNPKEYRRQFKSSNPGKMPNNQDPYPVDLKIEELEFHKPDVKVYKVTTPNEGIAATETAMKVGDAAEKRIVKLENMLATVYRLLFRLGTRVPINCQYYGGQSPFD